MSPARCCVSMHKENLKKKNCTHFDFVAFGQFKVQAEGIDDGGEQEGLLPGKHSFWRHHHQMSIFQRADASVWVSNRRTVTALHFLLDARSFAQHATAMQPFCPYAFSFLRCHAACQAPIDPPSFKPLILFEAAQTCPY